MSIANGSDEYAFNGLYGWNMTANRITEAITAMGFFCDLTVFLNLLK